MKRWFYKVLNLPASHEMDEEILNIQGEQGWELISVVLDAQHERLCYLRKLDESSAPRRGIPDAKTEVE